MSGNSFWNLSSSSSPVTLTAESVSNGLSKSSNEKLLLARAARAGAGVGMSPMPSREISGKADAARSKSMSSPDPMSVLWDEENSPPRKSASRENKSVMVASQCSRGNLHHLQLNAVEYSGFAGALSTRSIPSSCSAEYRC